MTIFYYDADRSARPFLRCSAFLAPSLLIHPRQHHRRRPPKCVAPESNMAHTAPSTKSTHIHSPVIHRYEDDSEESYAMWYTSHQPNTASSIHLATSSDGVTFTAIEGMHDGAVLSNNAEQWWAFDTGHVTLGDVVTGSSSRVRADGDVVFLYYAGVTGEHDFGLRNRLSGGRIGVALSKDGQYFSRIEGLLPTGAVLEGDEGTFDQFGVCAPCVTRVGTTMVMHYHTYSEGEGYMLGKAVSDDGISFTKTGRIVLTEGEDFASRGVLNPCVVENQGRYAMFVEVASRQGSGIAVCESENCETWGPLKLVREADSEEGVGTPCAIPMSDHSLRLYYTRSVKGDTSVAFAESHGTDWMRFNTITSLLDIQ